MATPMEDPVPTLRPRHRARRWVLAVALSVAIGVTGYLGTMTVLWYLHIHELRTLAGDTVDLDASQKSAVRTQATKIADAQDALAEGLTAVSDVADKKASAEDFRYIDHYFALTFLDCANAQSKTLNYARHLNLYYISDVRRYAKDVNGYCDDAKTAWAEALAEQQP